MPSDASGGVLVVGAGPTGLALAMELHAFGIRARIIDRQPDRVHESRALAVQPRTLEVLANLSLAEAMVERGNPAVRLHIHAGRRVAEVPLFDVGLDDTAYPFLLFISQAETEAILGDRLAELGVPIERGTELTDLDQHSDHVVCTLAHHDGSTERLSAEYVIGCDGAHSTVRDRAGIAFVGSAYPQTFVLADLHADVLQPSTAHAYLSERGLLFFFPLGRPAPWRMLAMRPEADETSPPRAESPQLAELQALADAYAIPPPQLHDPVWRTYFRLHHRHAVAYRERRVFLAGDAAHIHSPAGGQGMNTGIQDAINLGWKLGLVLTGVAHPALLDTYQIERQPVGREVVRFTDRAFTIATSTNPLLRFVRGRVAPRLVPLAARAMPGRRYGFRTISQLAIGYRSSPVVHEGKPALRRGPKAGDRLPDASLVRDGEPLTLHRALAAPQFHALLIGPIGDWRSDEVAELTGRYDTRVVVHQLTRQFAPGALHDPDGSAHKRLGVKPTGRSAHYLVRPDGHIAYRAAGTDLDGLHRYLQRSLPGARHTG